MQSKLPHNQSVRGRSNVLGNVLQKPLRQIFRDGKKPVDEGARFYTRTGDVKYHLGASCDRPTKGGKRIHLSSLDNPSRLEALGPRIWLF